MKYIAAFTSALILAGPSFAGATIYYVSGTGSDGNTGLSAGQALRHLQTAADLTRPGDTVMVMNGTYTPAAAGYDVLDISISGTPSRWIVYRAAPGQHPMIDFTNGWNGIHIDAAYIVVGGFEVAGGAQHVTLAYAEAQANNLDNYLTSANGIVADNSMTGLTPHHLVIENNVVHDAPGGGIATCYADYVTIRGNDTYRNAYWSPYANSGISIWEMRDVDGNTGYKNWIVDNVSHDNQEFIPFYAAGKITDGNGIIVDDNENTQSQNVAYGGRTYVANNVVYSNGGSGIHTYASQHVDIVNNTAYLNNQSPAINEGQIFANTANDVNILNNIGVAPANKVFYSAYNNGAGVVYDYNLLFSSTIGASRAGVAPGPHDIVAHPYLADPTRNFRLTANSPAIGSGTVTLAPATDFAGTPRSATKGIDRGAYAFE